MAKKEKVNVRCIQCKRATLMRWFRNPVICECDGVRHVAEALHGCVMFEEAKRQNAVKQYDSY